MFTKLKPTLMKPVGPRSTEQGTPQYSNTAASCSVTIKRVRLHTNTMITSAESLLIYEATIGITPTCGTVTLPVSPPACMSMSQAYSSVSLSAGRPWAENIA